MENIDGLDSNSTHNIVKGKRTKRMRLLSSTTTTVAANTNVVTMTSSCSSANSGGSSTTTYESEEEDMANCLILLAQGGESYHSHHDNKQEDCEGNKTEKEGNSNTSTTTVANTTKVGFYIYECKTCNRSFPSFQALGGHRASHKKPKLVAEEKKLPPTLSSPPPPSQLPHMIVTNYDRFEEANVKIGPPISLSNTNKAKIHECSICGSEFTSGQALGGHMRRHRASTNNTNTVVDTSCNFVTTQPRKILQLDLNLPALPEDDVREVKFQLATNQILVETPALVDCHY